MADTGDEHHNSAGALETMPLIVGVVGISIPVGLAAAAAVTESVVLLVLAVIAVFCVGAGTLAFVMRLASDTPESADGVDAGSAE